VSPYPCKIDAWSSLTTNRKVPTPRPMVTWSMTSRDPKRSRSWPQNLWSPVSPYPCKIDAWCQVALFLTQIVAGMCVWRLWKIELSIYFSCQINLLSVFFTVRVTFIVDLVVGRVGNTSAGAFSNASNAMCVYHCRCMVSRTCTCVPRSMPVSKRVVSCDLRYVTGFLVPCCVSL